MEQVIIAGFAVYAITFLITVSHIAEKPRRWWRKMHKGTLLGQSKEFDFISCAMCTGFWVAMLTCLWDLGFWDTVAAYGVSYFLRTLERNE